jgi:hypothetical protein
MGTTLIVLIVYCLVCWAAGLALWWFKSAVFAGCEAEVRLPPETARAAWRVALVTAPLWVPVIAAVVVWVLGQDFVRAVRYARLRRKNRVYQEYRFTPVSNTQLDRDTREFFHRSSGELLPLGFRALGDFQLKQQPLSVTDRFFLRDDGAILATASFIEAVERRGSVSLDSWLADGVYVSTAAIEDDHADPPADPEIDRMHIEWAGWLSTTDLMARHVEQVAALARRRETDVLTFESAQLESLVIQSQRLFHQWVHKLGKSTPPPEPVLPTPSGRLTPDELLLTLAAVAAERETASETPLTCCEA